MVEYLEDEGGDEYSNGCFEDFTGRQVTSHVNP
jgi:hypothetical protein